MSQPDERYSAVIMIGGPTLGTRFRPLSLSLPKQLFPVGGKPMIYHPLLACKREFGDKMKSVFLQGTYPESEFTQFMKETGDELGLDIHYLYEPDAYGTAGGLFVNKEQIIEDVDYFFVIHADICCTFPLRDILETHKKTGAVGTNMSVTVSSDNAMFFGCMVYDPTTCKMLHYAEKPDSFISDTINAGIYCFSSSLLNQSFLRSSSSVSLETFLPDELECKEHVFYKSMERDLVPQLCLKGQMAVHHYTDFWKPMKHSSSAIYCSDLYLKYYTKLKASWILQGSPYVGSVVIDKTAVIDPSAKIGPNVYIAPGVVVGRGVRISNAIIMNDSILKDHCCILFSILNPRCTIGSWTRIEGVLSTDMRLSQSVSLKSRGELITVLGSDVSVNPELMVRNCIVMPHKKLDSVCVDEVLL